MTKKTGFKVNIVAFVEIDKKDFGKQAAAFAMMDTITRTGKLPDGFMASASILAINAKQGSADIPDQPASEPDKNDPASWPLTTDGLPDGATILEQSEALDLSVIQTIRLADGTETLRRISADQAAAEDAASAPNEMVGDKVTRRGGKPVTE